MIGTLVKNVFRIFNQLMVSRLGFLIAFWCVPTMTVGHLLFSAVASSYIFLAVHFLEERDLIKVFGERYRSYRAAVPSFFPVRFSREAR